MRTLYFDCFAGASGDMILGALVSAGVEAGALRERLAALNLSGVEVKFDSIDRSGISCVRADVRTSQDHAHRHLGDILRIIYDARLSDGVKERAARIFSRLGEAEARVHNVPVERIHFHEVGALDAIIDVVGACIGFELLGIERFVSSPLHVGRGMVEMAHGRFPVPPPAVVELLRGVPIYASEIMGELVTPTGAAIISTVCEAYGPVPLMRLERFGYGAGAREYERFPNALRVLIGETVDERTSERLSVLETNIDDASPQLLGHVMDRALQAGALDCFFTPAQMKKNRPGVLVSILCRPQDKERMMTLLFAETTTLGIRAYEVERWALERESWPVETAFGPVEVKIARLNGQIIGGTPEYETCRAIAEKKGVPLREVEAAARAAFSKLVSDGELSRKV